MTNFLHQAQDIMLRPRTTWAALRGERPHTRRILSFYVLPLCAAAALAAFIGYGFIWSMASVPWGIYQAVLSVVLSIVSVCAGAWIVDIWAPVFHSEKNYGRSLQLVAYSYTPVWAGGLLAVYPPLAVVILLFGMYALYLFYQGIPVMKKTPAGKHASYAVVSLLSILVLYGIVRMVLVAISRDVSGVSPFSAG